MMLSVDKETSQMFWENQKPDLNFFQNYRESRVVGEDGRDETRLDNEFVSFETGWWIHGIPHSHHSTFAFLRLCLNFSIMCFFEILGFNCFPAGVYTLNTETKMFIVHVYYRLYSSQMFPISIESWFPHLSCTSS